MKHRSFRHEVQVAGVLLAGLAMVAAVHAQEHAARTEAQLHLSTPGSCVTESGIDAGVRQRSERIALVERDGVVMLEVSVAERGREVRAELSVRWPDGRRAQRTLAATSCQQLTAAVALVISMTLDPTSDSASGARRAVTPARDRSSDSRAGASGDSIPARGLDVAAGGNASTPTAERSAPPPHGQRSEPAAALSITPGQAGAARTTTSPATQADAAAARDAFATPAPRSAAADGGTSERSANVTLAPAEASTEPSPPAAAASPAANGGDGFFRLDTWSVGAEASFAFGPAPRALPGIGAYLWLAWHGAAPWSPALRLDLSHAWLNDYAADGGKASFALDSAELELCPLALRAGPLAGYACASAQLGALSASGTDTYRPAEHTQLWSAFGVALLASLHIADWAEAQLGSALRAPAQRDRFAFTPDVFHRVGWLTLELRASLGVRFP